MVNAVVEVVVVLLKILLVVGSVGLVAGCFEAGRMQLRNNRGGRFLELPPGTFGPELNNPKDISKVRKLVK
jgi:hypothetical protein